MWVVGVYPEIYDWAASHERRRPAADEPPQLHQPAIHERPQERTHAHTAQGLVLHAPADMLLG
jgi:hypothetical protein